MIIYFDESYDSDHDYLIFAALFNPHHKFLHRRLREIKNEEDFYKDDGAPRELKYSRIKNAKSLHVGQKAIDAFIQSTSWFRCVVIKQNLIDLNYFGTPQEPDSIKNARLYKKFAEMLIAHNTENLLKAILLTDNLTRCKGDEFIEVMKQEFCIPFSKYSENSHIPRLSDVMDIQSHLEQNHVCQINDILAGCVLNNLKPSAIFKNKLREYLVTRLGVKDLLPDTWKGYTKTHSEVFYPKFNIWYWEPKKKT
jgi:hypothetical protein